MINCNPHVKCADFYFGKLNMLCAIYKSKKKLGSYLYVANREDFSSVPSVLLEHFGKPELVMMLWGSDNICIRKKKKFGGKKLVGAPVCGALAFLGGKFMQKWKMVGIGGKWSKIGFYFA